MPRAGIEPATHGFSVHCSTNWAIWARLLKTSCGGRIWTYDLRVMSPTSFQTAPPRDVSFKLLYSIFIKISIVFNGRRWIRTTEASCSRFTVCPLWPLGNPPIFNSYWIARFSAKPMIGLEPITCWLQISCSANWATSAYILQMTPTGIEPVLPPWKGDVLTAWPRSLICKHLSVFNSPCWTRTNDNSVNSRVLYRLS